MAFRPRHAHCAARIASGFELPLEEAEAFCTRHVATLNTLMDGTGPPCLLLGGAHKVRSLNVQRSTARLLTTRTVRPAQDKKTTASDLAFAQGSDIAAGGKVMYFMRNTTGNKAIDLEKVRTTHAFLSGCPSSHMLRTCRKMTTLSSLVNWCKRL